MPTESSEDKPDDQLPKNVVVESPILESKVLKADVMNTFEMPKAYISGSNGHPDTRANKKDMLKSASLGDPWMYDQYNNEVNKSPTQAPYWPNTETNEPPGLVRERAANAEDINQSFVDQSVPKVSTDERVHLTDLAGSAKLVYKSKK
jgi:hypothetical protein